MPPSTCAEIAAILFCSRSSVYRTVHVYRENTRGWKHWLQKGERDILRFVCQLSVVVATRQLRGF